MRRGNGSLCRGRALRVVVANPSGTRELPPPGSDLRVIARSQRLLCVGEAAAIAADRDGRCTDHGDPCSARSLARHLWCATRSCRARGQGSYIGLKRVARLMTQAGLAGVSRRRFVTTTVRGDSRQAPDLVERNFTAEAPDRLWVADITYIPTWAGFLYLAVVLDAYSRRIVGWSMATTLATQLVLDALNMALVTRRPTGVIHHSDQGSQAGLKWSSQHFEGGVAMTRRRRRSDRSGRAPLFSPGRPVVAGRDEQRRFWAAIAAGMASEDAAVQAGMSQAVGTRLFRKAGGMPPAMFRPSAKPLSGRYLSFAEREEIALLRVQGCSMREVGAGSDEQLQRSRGSAAQRFDPKRRLGVSRDHGAVACRAIWSCR